MEIDNIGKNINNFIQEFRARYKENFEENPEDKTKEGFTKVIYQLLELQNIYYQDYKKASSLNDILKSYFLSYSENFRYSNKKNNRLNEMFETLAIKEKFAFDLNRQENQQIKENINLNKKELIIYKDVLKVKYDQGLFEKYKDELNSKKCKSD